jgi:hypothetical protein
MTELVQFRDLEGNLRSYSVRPDITVELTESPPSPSPSVTHEIDRLWKEALDRKDRLLFDGTVLSVANITPEQITVFKDSYRAFHAQSVKPELYDDLRIRPLACSGRLKCLDGLIFAKRSTEMFLDPGCWELAPSGTFDAHSISLDEKIDIGEFLLRELHEELGIQASHAQTGSVLGLYEQMDFKGIDLVVAIDLPLSGDDVQNCFQNSTNKEYSALVIVPKSEVRAFVAQSNSPFVQLSVRVLEQDGLI